MSYISKHTGTVIDNAIDINDIQNNRLNDIENKNTDLQAQIDNLVSLLKNYWENIYPIGSIYISLNTSNPSDLFGGTWEQISGRFLLGTGLCSENSDSSFFGTIKYPNYWNASVGTTGGEDFHTLTVNEMPSHTHGMTLNNYKDNNYMGGFKWEYTNSGYFKGSDSYILYEGGGITHNNIPHYLAVCMWKRIA